MTIYLQARGTDPTGLCALLILLGLHTVLREEWRHPLLLAPP